MFFSSYLDLAPKSSPVGGGGGGNFPSYWGWEFDNNLLDTTSTQVITSTGASYSNQASPPANPWQDGIVDVAAHTPSARLDNSPNEFRLEWGTPWALTAWFFVRFSNRTYALDQYTGNLGTLSWRWRFGSTGYGIVYDQLGGTEVCNLSIGVNLGAWNFFAIRHNPANPRQIQASANNGSFNSYTFSLDYKPSSDYGSDQTLLLYPSVSFPDCAVDQLALWHGSVLTDQNIADLYNGGAGRLLP